MAMVLGGIASSDIVAAALGDPALAEAAIVRFEPSCSPPCDGMLWRLETASGTPLNEAGFVSRHWHRAPYAVTVCLVRYAPGSVVPDVLDEGTIGNRGTRSQFKTALDRVAMRFVRDAILGHGRGPAGGQAADPTRGLPGWIGRLGAKWHGRVMSEWWSLGTASCTLNHVLAGGGLEPIRWFNPKAGQNYLADPFPWPGDSRILCEEMPLTVGPGRIVSVSEIDGALSAPAVILDDGYHHSYPSTFTEGGVAYCVPEAPERGATRIHELRNNGGLVPVCDVAPHARLADPTLFRRGGRYWLACTDLDLGSHDNLCLLHAPQLTGPWTQHATWPVKIDVRGARPAGMIFDVDGRLYRPAQDCAETYGAGVALHEILTLTETEFKEALVTVLRPARGGPFPHGLHTLVHDGDRFWVDGKRFVLDLKTLRHKVVSRAARLFLGTKVA